MGAMVRRHALAFNTYAARSTGPVVSNVLADGVASTRASVPTALPGAPASGANATLNVPDVLRGCCGAGPQPLLG